MSLSVRALGVLGDGQTLVDDFSISLRPGTVHAVVGESGSGKTLAALAVLGLLPEGLTARGEALLSGVDLLKLGPHQRRAGVAMVLQEPRTALNPVRSVGAQLNEAIRVAHPRIDVAARAHALLTEVGLPAAEPLLRSYAHQLSGGQLQRVALACALAAAPQVLIVDEPTTHLDAPVRGLILALLRRLSREHSLAVWLMTHDLNALRGTCDDICVMYAGGVVEQGPAAQLLTHPRHPYTAALFASDVGRATPGVPMQVLPGAVPTALDQIPGCRFHPRCPVAIDRCSFEPPKRVDQVACHLVPRFSP